MYYLHYSAQLAIHKKNTLPLNVLLEFSPKDLNGDY